MFCFKCGAEISDNSAFCEKCGEKQKNTADEIIREILDNQPKVILDPEEQTQPKAVKDSSSSASALGKPFGVALIVISIILSLVSMLIGFIPITIVSVFMFVIGWVIIIFSR